MDGDGTDESAVSDISNSEVRVYWAGHILIELQGQAHERIEVYEFKGGPNRRFGDSLSSAVDMIEDGVSDHLIGDTTVQFGSGSTWSEGAAYIFSRSALIATHRKSDHD